MSNPNDVARRNHARAEARIASRHAQIENVLVKEVAFHPEHKQHGVAFMSDGAQLHFSDTDAVVVPPNNSGPTYLLPLEEDLGVGESGFGGPEPGAEKYVQAWFEESQDAPSREMTEEEIKFDKMVWEEY